MQPIQHSLSAQLGRLLLAQQAYLVTAESCTGGKIAAAITDIEGSSQWFDRAFITYTNAAKQQMLGVSEASLIQFGAVSEPVVLAMAQGALQHSQAQFAIAVSGIAGPGGGSVEKPVGTVCFAWLSDQGWQRLETRHFQGDRHQVRDQAVEHGLAILIQWLTTKKR